MKAGRQDSHYTPSAFEIAAPRSNKINNPTFMSSASHGAVSLSSDHLGSAGLGCVLWQQEEGAQIGRLQGPTFSIYQPVILIFRERCCKS